MTIVFKLNDHTSIELEEVCYSPGHEGYYSGPPDRCYPAEGPDCEFIKGWIIRNNQRRKVDVNRLEHALIRRYGYNWQDEAEVE